MKVDNLSKTLRSVAICAAKGGLYPKTFNVHFHSDGSVLRIEATDTFRFARALLPGEGERFDCLVAARDLRKLPKGADTIAADDNFLYINDTPYSCSHDSYFDLDRHVPAFQGEFKLLASELSPHIAVISALREKKLPLPVRMFLGRRGLHLRARDYMAKVSAEGDMDEFHIAIDVLFLREMLRAFKYLGVDDIIMRVSSRSSPVSFVPAHGVRYEHVIMPMFVEWG